MEKRIIQALSLITLLLGGLIASTGCDAVRGGATIVLEGVTMGTMTMDGKPVTGMPAPTVNVKLKVPTSTVKVITSGNNTILKLEPSGATVTSGPGGIQFTGVKEDQIEIEWPKTDK
jgi:hypothetical protein